MDGLSSGQLSWPYVLQFDTAPHLRPLLEHCAARCEASGLQVSLLSEDGLLTVRQPRKYAELFASHAGTRKALVGQEGRRAFDRAASAAFKDAGSSDFFCASEAAHLTELHLASIKVDASSQALLERLCGAAGREHNARLGADLLEACRSLELLVASFPAHEAGRVSALWKSSRLLLLPAPTQWREYFGDGVGFYVAWMRHFTLWLAVPSLLGLASASYHVLNGLTVDDNPYAPLYAIFMILWATAFNKCWCRRVAALQMEWHGALAPRDFAGLGTAPAGAAPAQRHGFTGVPRQHPITGNPELHYPGWKRGLKCIASWAVTALMLQLAFLIMIASLNFQGYVHRRNGLLHVPLFASYAAPGRAFDPAGSLFFVPTICHTISIFVLNSLYRKVATQLTEWENHSTDEAFESSLLRKRFAFEAFDCYIALFYLAFWELDVNLVRSELISLYMADCARRLVVETLLPAATQWVSTLTARRADKQAKAAATPGGEERARSASVAVANSRMAEYEAFDDYLEMVIQYGYIVMFASAFPAASAISALYNIIELKSDTYKLCFLYRRPKPLPAHGIGTWGDVLWLQTWLAVLTNLAIFGFSSEQMKTWLPSWFVVDNLDHPLPADGHGGFVVLALFLVEHVVVLGMVALLALVPDVPKAVRQAVEREQYRAQRLAAAHQSQELHSMTDGR
mmetsp:Transcript_15959/g.40546  ORF Transcript_15959/g.40546 Transcript_15959/m.40546 type:complete len:684 (-) Transcript_15959:3086-5137(-)